MPAYDFTQANSKKFLENDESREILYNFLKKVGATDRVNKQSEFKQVLYPQSALRTIYLTVDGPMYEWQRETDGSILIVYMNNGNPVEFVGKADRAKWVEA